MMKSRGSREWWELSKFALLTIVTIYFVRYILLYPREEVHCSRLLLVVVMPLLYCVNVSLVIV